MRYLDRLPPFWRSAADLVITLVIAGLIVWVARAFVLKPYTVPTTSMEPTLMPHDYIIADRLILDFDHPHRFQIVVFHPPHCKTDNDSMGVCQTRSLAQRDGLSGTTYVKRVIGLPGDTITVSPDHQHLIVKPANGGPSYQLKEPWVMNHQELAGKAFPSPWTIPKGYYLMLGDNRAISDDSRYWGLEPQAGLIGIARLRYWPLSRIGIP